MMQRRSFLLGLGAAGITLAAPAVVRAESLMKIWVPPRSMISYTPPSQLLLDQMADIQAVRHRITEQWFMEYDSWRRIYFDEDRQEVISEQISPERMFVEVPNGKLFMPENAPLGSVVTVHK